jgi:DNA repair photolyase
MFVRWSNLTLSEDEQHRLPGYRDEAIVRRFDAPEALETRFYEVRARSVLNRVPGKSRMPFRWTINPYRGCSHACVYCLWGETPILMADGRHKPLSQIRVGDAIYGTVREGVYRRFTPTCVLAHWSSIKPAYRIKLEDGSELIASADHRFLTGRGWKHVIGAEQGPLQRPHLTLNSKLMGVGSFAASPMQAVDYRRGYLCGLIRGDGHLGSYSYERVGRTHGDVHRFRLALADGEALQRARTYLLQVGIVTDEFLFAQAAEGHRAMTAIRTSAKAQVDQIREVIAWPNSPGDEWCKGFLAGIFDAEGSCGPRGVIRITNTDSEIIDWTATSMRRFGFEIAVEDRGLPNRLISLRIRGGLPENLRFFHTTDPAIERKRSLAGKAVKTTARLNVVAIESLGMAMRLYDLTTGTGDFIANGVVSHNCFARPTHRYLDFDAGRDFEREIVVKVNAPEVLRAELARPSWGGEHVALGTNTDPYQWVEGRYRLMVGIWEALRNAANPCSVLTKSPLLLRDLPLMLEIAERASFSACLSIPTLDERAWRATEPHTPNPRARLEAVAELNRAGIPTGVLIAPLMPGINDAPHQIEPLLQRAVAAGATSIGGMALHLRGEVRDVFMGWLQTQRPDLVERYEQLYSRGAYAPREERERLSGLVRSAGRRTPRGLTRVRSPAPQAPAGPTVPPASRQEALF